MIFRKHSTLTIHKNPTKTNLNRKFPIAIRFGFPKLDRDDD